MEDELIEQTTRRIPRRKPGEKERQRFGLRNGQFFGYYMFKDLWWVLNGRAIGFGDLRESDIQNIQQNLRDGEAFIGWNEHDGGEFQQTKRPIIRITKKGITYPHRESFGSR